ncbi:MAG: hypothetical protein M1834_006142 [Cirrosporium novae-zelandiae]|nr:MAG: hypothetical protein M1834_006142 [Cirrosporium novae-zelandiae]
MGLISNLAFIWLLIWVTVAARSFTDQQEVLQPSIATPPSSVYHFNYSSSAPHIFASVRGLLQQWPNTFFPNGHTIAPCEIRSFTNFYHGRQDEGLPPSPEWFSFDIEMAYGIMGSTRNSHMLIYQTTRPVGCLYFDGESAALMGAGAMDSQMVFLYGNTTGSPHDGQWRGLGDEYDRAMGLCNWVKDNGFGGLGWGIEGIIRMNAGFEMIWCNFTSPSIRLISHLNVTAPLLQDDESELSPKLQIRTIQLIQKILLDPQIGGEIQTESLFCHLKVGVGLLAPLGGMALLVKGLPLELVRSEEEQRRLNLTKFGFWNSPTDSRNRKIALQALTRRRRQHRLTGISQSDASLMNDAAKRALTNLGFSNSSQIARQPCTGIDWSNLADEIVQRHANSLVILQLSLNDTDSLTNQNNTACRQWLSNVRSQMHSFLLPFLEYPQSQNSPNLWTRSSSFGQETYSRCRYQHTRLLASDQDIALGFEERVLISAFEETLGGICTMIIDVGFAVERMWNGLYSSNHPTAAHTCADILPEAKDWLNEVEELMAWLGWAQEWVRCEERCEWDEKCYIPMWPLIHMDMPRGPPPSPYRDPYRKAANGHSHRLPYDKPDGPPYGHPPPWEIDDEDLWNPKCVKANYIMR